MEHRLAKILLGLTPGEVTPDDGDDEEIKHFYELTCRSLVALPDGLKERRSDVGSR